MEHLNSESVRPLQFVKVLSWSFLFLILSFNLGLSVFISNYADKTLLEKQREFSLLLAENLSHQVYTRFALPTMLAYGRLQLSQDKQAELLDQVVRSTIHSFHVDKVRIHSLQEQVVYSTDLEELGREDLSSDHVVQAMTEKTFSFQFTSSVSKVGALFRFNMPPGSILLTTYYPLYSEISLDPTAKEELMGVLEFTQDITDDYMAVVNFERLVVLMSLITSIILFTVILMVLQRADRLNQERLAEREKLERELMQQEKLAGMGRMVAGVAHEIRNPLGIIRSSAELVLKKAKQEGHPQERLLQAMFDESTRLSRVVTDFLDYARPKQPAMQPVDLGRVVEQVAVFLENEAAKKEIVIRRDVKDEQMVMGDKDLLYRALYNIVSNAIQAMDRPGEITIKAAHEVDVVHLIVLDQGPGIPDDLVEKVRDPFFTTKETGTGLGLAITASILEGHGAQWSISNGPDGGARVDIIFRTPYESVH